MKRRHARRLRAMGIRVCCFMPVVFPWLTSKLNNRNHRKIVVVDGKIGFTGGINVADRYVHGTKFGPWRDTHLRIEGDAVNMLQAIFMTDWYFVSGKELLNDEKYFPKSRIRTRSPMQIASSGPDSDWASIMQAFFAAINKARKSIYISTPYFLPNQAILTALKVAALSGVDVRIILPFRSDSKIVYWASRSYIGEMLDAGIKVYFFCKGFNHSKILIIDDNFCSVGSANMDIRSFEDNFEVSAIMYDPKVAEELTGYFLGDIGNSVAVTPRIVGEPPQSPCRLRIPRPLGKPAAVGRGAYALMLLAFKLAKYQLYNLDTPSSSSILWCQPSECSFVTSVNFRMVPSGLVLSNFIFPV